MLVSLVIIALVFANTPKVFSQVPRSISYQGLLLISGKPVNSTVSLEVRIYNAAGDTLYSESMNPVQVSGGVFNILLGGKGGNLPASLNFDEQYYLGIDVNSTGEMLPRTPFAAAPYALNSQTVGGVGVSITPQPGMLLPLDATGKFPKSVFPTSGIFITGINGVAGDGSGNVKIVSGDINTLRITDDAPNNRIILNVVPQAESGVVIANGLIGSGLGKYSGSIPIPQNALSMKISYPDIKAASNVIVTIFDPAGQTDQVTVGVITAGVGFDVHFAGYYPTPNGKLNYLVIH